MTRTFSFLKINQSRIATFDVFAVGLNKHHVSAMLEFDVTESRKKLREVRRKGIKVSFNAWLIKVISKALVIHPETAAYLYSKRKLIVFNDINISMVVEKEVDGCKVPIPLVLEKTNDKSIEAITEEIEKAKNQHLTKEDIVLNRKTKLYEKVYYHLPGFLRRHFWKYLLHHPKTAYKLMGNVAITSLGMMGKINGWFIHKSVHPISLGIGSVLQKPTVNNGEIQIREILNMTILIDHDVVDGAPMAKFLNDLTDFIEKGEGL